MAGQSFADDNNSSGSNKPRNGLFSQVNNWFSRLRGNRDNNNSNSNSNSNSNDSSEDKKNDEKKEEASKPNPVPAMYHPGMGPMAGFAPMNPFGSPMMGSPMAYGPGSMGMPTHQFAHHVPAHGRPMGAPPGMGMSFGGMGMGGMSPMSNPFAYSGSHMMP